MLKGEPTNATAQSGNVTARPAVKFAAPASANSTNKTVSPKEKKNASIGINMRFYVLIHFK